MANADCSNPLISTDVIHKNGQQIIIATFHNCITALKQYENKSLEELRWEDYQLNKRYPSHLPMPTLCRLPPPSLAIIQQTGSTSIPLNDQRSTIKGSFQSKYKHSHGADIKTTDNKSFIYFDTTYISITAMHEYENKSFEEIRYEDYLNDHKYSKTTPSDNAIKPSPIERKDSIINDNKDDSVVDIACPICLETIANVIKLIEFSKFFQRVHYYYYFS